MKNRRLSSIVLALMLTSFTASAQTFQLNADGYFNAGGTDVMVFNDFYPEGHQGGVCVIMNGQRIATNGDIRLEARLTIFRCQRKPTSNLPSRV
ncbi:MAG: hypothetical protein K6C10_12675 [Prevotella sp.]|nr:hypothetical protein [Prevotella sp.]